MVIIVVFLLAVLFVAAVWGREAAQRLFKGGMKVAGVLFGIVAFIVILLAINLQPPKQADIDQSLAAGQSSAYYVPLDPPSSDSGAVRQRPESVNVAPSNMYNGDLGNPKIGIGLAMLNSQNGALYGLPSGYGVYVASVGEGTTAWNVGIRVGDYISVVDGKWITDLDAINRNNVGKRPGDIIVLRVLRGGQQYDIRVPLGHP